jgi:hypothetical protein
MQFKGAGTINGMGNYGFMLSAIDSDLTPSTETDKFRIKIWILDNDIVVYDNELNELLDDFTPTTDIAGGSIVIHKKDDKKSASVIDPTAKINIYPNPFENSIYVDLFTETTHEIIIDMVDMNGRIIEYLYTGVIAAELDHHFEFNTKADLTPGSYILRIRAENGELIGREIIIKR